LPKAKLVAFRRIALSPGQSASPRFELAHDRFLSVNEKGERVLVPGEYELIVGGASPDPRGEALGGAKPVSAKFKLVN
jgi:beta-glucosidase